MSTTGNYLNAGDRGTDNSPSAFAVLADQASQVANLQYANKLKLQQDQAEFVQRQKQIDLLNASQETQKPIINTELGKTITNLNSGYDIGAKVIKPSTDATPPNAMMTLANGALGTVTGQPIPQTPTNLPPTPTQNMVQSATTAVPQVASPIEQPNPVMQSPLGTPQVQQTTVKPEPRYSMALKDNKWVTVDNKDELRKLQETAANSGVIPFDQTGASKPRTQILTELAQAKAAKTTNDNLLAGSQNIPALTSNATPEDKQAFLSKLQPGVAGIVKGLSDYSLDLSKVSSIRGDQRLQLAELVKQYDPTFDMNQYAARKNFINNLANGPLSKSIISANQLIGHINGLQQAYTDLHNTSIPLINAAGNLAKTATGSGAPTKVHTNAAAVANELEALFRGSGGGSEQGIQDWKKSISDNASPEQSSAFIQKAIELMSSRLGAIDSQYQNIMGKPKEFSVLNNKSKAILKKLNIDPSQVEGDIGGSDNSDSSTTQKDYSSLWN